MPTTTVGWPSFAGRVRVKRCWLRFRVRPGIIVQASKLLVFVTVSLPNPVPQKGIESPLSEVGEGVGGEVASV
jgi:hypothetical protein